MRSSIPAEIITTMLDKILRVDCDAEYSPRTEIVARARKEYTSQLGDVIHRGDYYYYVQTVGILPYVSVVRPPVAYKNMLFAPGSEGYRKAMARYNELEEKRRLLERNSNPTSKIKSGDMVAYGGKKYLVKDVLRVGCLTSPFALLYDIERKQYLSDNITKAIIMVAACYCKKIESVKIFGCYKADDSDYDEQLKSSAETPEMVWYGNNVEDACEYFCKELGDDFTYSELEDREDVVGDFIYECSDSYGYTYLVKEIKTLEV